MRKLRFFQTELLPLLLWVTGSDILNIDPTPTELTTVNEPA